MTAHLARRPGRAEHGGDGDAPRGQHRARRRGRTWGQRAVIFCGALSAVVLGASSGGLAYLYRKVERIPRIDLSASLEQPEESGSPQNYLIVGVDNDEGVAPDDPIRAGRDGEQNTDTIMVVRVDPGREQASILSLPRDLWVPYPDGSNHRINGAYARGAQRPDLLIRIINEYLGIPINHYVQIDFAGFYRLVDAIDGVPVYFPHPARDRHSGLAVMETGCVTLERDQAIGYVRSRYYEQLIPDEDDPEQEQWVPDGLSDYGRVQRQQDFIRRALQRAVSKGARNPGTMNRLLDVGLESVTIDDDLTSGAIFDLARRFQSFDPNSLENFTLPTVGDMVGAAQILRLVESEAEPILAQFRGPEAERRTDADTGEGEGDAGDGGSGEASDIQPQEVRLTVLNGTGAPGQATETGDALAAVGFSVIGRRDAEGDDLGLDHTVVRYPAGAEAQAELVARWLTSGAEMVEMSSDDDAPAEQTAMGIEVITGADWDGVRSEPAPASSASTSSPSSPSSTSTTSTTITSETPSSTTTTTVLPQC